MNSLYKQIKFMTQKLHKLLFPPLEINKKIYQFTRDFKL